MGIKGYRLIAARESIKSYITSKSNWTKEGRGYPICRLKLFVEKLGHVCLKSLIIFNI